MSTCLNRGASGGLAGDEDKKITHQTIQKTASHTKFLTLPSWHFPNLDRVTFSEDDQDIVISSRPRGSHGKGVRAITRAAFNLALLRLCARDSRPFPGVVLIDSPLVVYREPDTDEGAFPHDVKDAFYEAVAGAFGDVQVIILENDDPPDSVRATANVVAFTGTNQGRRGFIPQAAGVA